MKIQNNLMRSFLGVGRNAPIVALLGDLGWLPITTITKISCIGFWFRLSKMAEGRLKVHCHGYTSCLYMIDYRLKPPKIAVRAIRNSLVEE